MRLEFGNTKHIEYLRLTQALEHAKRIYEDTEGTSFCPYCGAAEMYDDEPLFSRQGGFGGVYQMTDVLTCAECYGICAHFDAFAFRDALRREIARELNPF